jgi:hypothetical protein
MKKDDYSKRKKSLNITWEKLYHDFFCNSKLKTACPDITQTDFMTKMFNHKEHAPSKNLYIVAFTPKGNKESSSAKKYISYMFHAHDDCEARFKNVRDYLISQKTPTRECWDYQSHPDIVEFQRIWEDLIPDLKQSGRNDVIENVIDDLILDNILDNQLNIIPRLGNLYLSLDHPRYSLTLAILSVIASTLFCFNLAENEHLPDNENANNEALFDLVLPPYKNQVESSVLETAKEYLSNDKKTLKEMEDYLSPKLKEAASRDSFFNEVGELNFLLAQKAKVAMSTNPSLTLTDKYKTYLKNAANCGHKDALRTKTNEYAYNLIYKARLIYENPTSSQHDVSNCCDYCLQILNLSPTVDKNYRGEASYILYKYINSNQYSSTTGESKYDFLRMSYRLGYTPAKNDWHKLEDRPITPSSNRADTNCDGICYANTDNVYAQTIEKTIPVSWGDKLFQFDLYHIKDSMNDNINYRFLFIHDSAEKNMRDFLELLQLFRELAMETIKCEIFLRHNYETAKPLVDTALSRVSNYMLPVYILDDSRHAAQQLLSMHPLFYPLKSVNFSLVEEKSKYTTLSYSKEHSDILLPKDLDKPILNFVILGTSSVAEWLVKEAFWLMGFKDNMVENRITILDCNGRQFEAKIKAQYPGMVKSEQNIQEIEIPAITGLDVDFSSPDLYETISDILETSPYNYFAVATDSDEDNLTLAMRLREILIRRSVQRNNEKEFYESSPVAFLCRNDNLSWISKGMVVEKEQHGNQWFNTWSLIPFGEISQYYSWDNITGGVFEKLSLCVHYQYSQISSEDAKKRNQKWIDATKDYYLKQYNQDSSRAIALSMPYRIFQFHDRDKNHICPSAWDITESDTFANVSQLSALSGRIYYSSMSSHDDEIKDLAKWEHSRWVRWMLSRGWVPATPEESIFAFKYGNPRQQLFVAKMHPCICTYDSLKILQNKLRDNCGINKDFFSADIANIKATKNLLDLEWIDFE